MSIFFPLGKKGLETIKPEEVDETCLILPPSQVITSSLQKPEYSHPLTISSASSPQNINGKAGNFPYPSHGGFGTSSYFDLWKKTLFKAKFEEGNISLEITKTFLEENPVPTWDSPEIGDLVLAKCDLALAYSTTIFRQELPKDIKEEFVFCKKTGIIETGTAKEDDEGPYQGYSPTLFLPCVLDLDGYVSMNEYDWSISAGLAKIVQTIPVTHPGLVQYDYVEKRNINPNSIIIYPGDIIKVGLFSVYWTPSEILTIVPGIVETRPKRDWFLDMWTTNIYRDRTEIEPITMPVIGVLGLLLDKRMVEYDLDSMGNIVYGSKYRSWFYQIMFGDRKPVWVQEPVWKCPKKILTKKYLPFL